MTPLHQEIKNILDKFGSDYNDDCINAIVALSNIKGERARLIAQVREETIEVAKKYMFDRDFEKFKSELALKK